MAYQALLDTSLNKAFNLAKDLAKDITFTKKPDAAFNFGTGSTEFSPNQTSIVKAVVYESKKKFKGANTIVQEMLVKSKDIGDATQYDTVTIDSKVWNIIEVLKNDGFISVLQISREA